VPKVTKWVKSLGMKKYAFSLACITLIGILFMILYNIKKDSSDGRLLVWKVSAKMIDERPMGYGIGMFQKEYNLYQGKYFASNNAKESEKKIADFVNMAYNDYIELGVETGVPGMIIFVSFYVILIYQAYRNKNIRALSVITAFAIMSLVSFVYSTIQAWVVLIAYGAYALNGGRFINISKLNSTVSLVCICALFILFTKFCELTYSQLKLHKLEIAFNKDATVDMSDIISIEPYIGTSEAYYHFRGRLQMSDKKYYEALRSFKKATLYTTDMRLFFSIFHCYDKLGKTSQGIRYIKSISNIVPQNLTSRNILLKWYDQSGNYQEALKTAFEMAGMQLKVTNPRSEKYQRGAILYIDAHKRDILTIESQK
jgi:tetratricopeptide (TPR) repeat protein